MDVLKISSFLLFIGLMFSCQIGLRGDSYSTADRKNTGAGNQRDSYSASSSNPFVSNKNRRDSYSSAGGNNKKILEKKDSYSSSGRSTKGSKHKDSYSSTQKVAFKWTFKKKSKSKAKFKEEDKYSTPRKKKKVKKRKPEMGLFNS